MATNVEDEKVDRVVMLKSRYANTISEAQQILYGPAIDDQTKATSAIDQEADKKKKKKKSERETQNLRRISSSTVKKRRRQDDQTKEVLREKADSPAEIKRLQETMNARRYKKKMEVERETERKLIEKRRETVERQREAARIAINNVKKTVDFDNLGAMNEFEKLIGFPLLE